MSNFKRIGKRLEKKAKDEKAKRHVKYAKQILEVLDELAVYLAANQAVTEDNIEEEFKKVTDLELGKLEKSYLLKKIAQHRWETGTKKT